MDARLLKSAIGVFLWCTLSAPAALAQNENWIQLPSVPAGSSPAITARGSDTNIGLILTPKGTGNVIVTSGSVGIGTTLPGANLDVYGAGAQLRVYDASLTRFIVTSPVAGSIESTGTYLNLNRVSSQSVTLAAGGGNVGIGTTVPTYPLTVNGNIGLLPTGGTNRTIDFGSSYGASALWLFNGGTGQRWGWGLNPGEMQFFSTAGTTNHFSWNSGGDLQPTGTNELMRLNTGTGYLGIGTAFPNAKLDVNSTSIIIEQSNTPADNATCTAGTIWWDANYIYVCTVSGNVKRATLSAF